MRAPSLRFATRPIGRAIDALRRTRNPVRVALAAAVLLAGGSAAMVPGTSGAFTAKVLNSTDSAASGSAFTCSDTFNDSANRSNAYFEYRLVASGTASTNDVSNADNGGTYQGTGPHPTGTAVSSTACPRDSGYFYAPDGSTNFISTTNQVGTAPTTFSIAIWFRTSAAGGYLLGLNNSQTGSGSSNTSYDRHLYLGPDGKLRFGTFLSGTYQVVPSTVAVNDGVWHQAVGTMSPGAGMALWIDGVKVASNATFTSAEANPTGYWRIGQGTLDSWPNAPANTYFQGGLRFAAAYRVVLSDAEIQAEYRNGKPGA